MNNNKQARKVLVHTCCAPCLSYSIEKLITDGYEPTVYFFNPNIQPQNEYNIRFNELSSYCNEKKYDYIYEHENQEQWLSVVKGLEQEKEGGNRCKACFQYRLENTALKAKELGFDCFTTVMTISPHKNTTIINKIGTSIGQTQEIMFLEENFKKNDGFKKSIELSKANNMYRQKYCGCIFSIRE